PQRQGGTDGLGLRRSGRGGRSRRAPERSGEEVHMTIRVVVALIWSVISGLGGGWLVLSPWALGGQSTTGTWTTLTNAQVRTGLGLIALAVVGLLVVVVEGISSLREAGVLKRRAPEPKPWEETAAREPARLFSEDLDQAMISLANALAADLNRDRRPGDSERARTAEPQ